MDQLILASAAFVGTHFLLSHPLRAPLVGAIGGMGFLGLYSLVAFATLGWMISAYLALPPQPPMWGISDALWALASAAMLVASVLFVGSLIGNPALPDPTAAARPEKQPRGVFAVTRHPMMWSFALWSLAHIAVYPTPANLVLTGAILVLALVGAALQDAKKRRLEPGFWPQWQRETAFVPFANLLSGRTRWSAAMPGIGVLVGGVLLWLAASWAHLPFAGIAAGIWRWL
ncbi:NnrU family protein [Sphingomonas japonica]|uniref:Membrane protein n=1 Tax=Sphingomonas japonica TaxID=511662 RepID=A0ABX0TZ29_9SPHN|nr:NnrU family protein [Sphingomonas japonica]NIJ23570.1 putative membrane protein [Sphingomonas japonica]